MISAFDVAPLGRWQGLCYVNRVQLGLTEKNFKKMESPGTARLNRFLVKWENSNYRSTGNFAM